VSLLWQLLLKLLGQTPKAQISIELLRHTDSTTLRLSLVAAAILIAPISEEALRAEAEADRGGAAHT